MRDNRPPDAEAPVEVLVVDDVPEVVHAVAAVLQRQRYAPVRLTLATSAKDALALARSRPFDVVMSDFRMPGVDGLEVLRAARESNPSGRRILMTGYNEIPTTREAMEAAGVDGYLHKPLHAQQLLLFVQAFLLPGSAVLAEHQAEARRVEAELHEAPPSPAPRPPSPSPRPTTS